MCSHPRTAPTTSLGPGLIRTAELKNAPLLRRVFHVLETLSLEAKVEAGAGITGKDNRSILRQGDGGVAPQDGGGSHLTVSVIHPEAGILRHLHGHGLAGGIADLVPAGIAIRLNGGVGGARASEQRGRCGRVHVEAALGVDPEDAVPLLQLVVHAVPAAHAGHLDLRAGGGLVRDPGGADIAGDRFRNLRDRGGVRQRQEIGRAHV